MNCITSAVEMFRANPCPSATIAVVGFVLGAVAACLACRVFCGCKVCDKSAGRKPMAKRGPDKPFEKRKPHPAPADGSVEIYVGNLSYEMTEDQLRKEFEAFGTVNSARLIINKFNGKSKGFGFVHMPNREEAEKACEALNDKEILGRRMKCNEAKNLI